MANRDKLISSTVECSENQRERDADCLHCAVRHRMLFADVDVESAQLLLRPIRHITQPRNATLYREGDAAKHLYSLRRGVIKLSMTSEDGDMRIVRLVGPGTTIGLEALVDKTYQHLAQPLTAVDVCRLPVTVVRELTVQQPDLCKRLMLQWQQQMAKADSHLVALSMGSIKKRVENLLYLVHDLCELGRTDFHLPSNFEIAALVAAREESVSRAVADMKRRGLLVPIDGDGWALSRSA